ncbi:MAG: RNA polymerase sigma factor [Clostridiales bacterium]|nr:RNA polymerase sigma factor [Clostridiales bacterium]
MKTQDYQEAAALYTDILYRAALSCCKNKADAEDAVQNTFVKLLKSDLCFQDKEHLRRWLIHVVINESRNIWKSFWQRNTVPIEEWDDAVSDENDRKRELYEAVMQLPAKYSVVVHLYYYEGYSVREIGGILGISESNVQTRLMRARNKLKKQLKEEWQ